VCSSDLVCQYLAGALISREFVKSASCGGRQSL
jgi:hypothetical protein